MTINAVGSRGDQAESRAFSQDHATSPSRSELDELAKALHDVGEKRGKKDDYDRRLQALASEFLPTLSPEDRGRFLGAILERDTGALKSWLQSDRLDKLVDNGRISEGDRQRVRDAAERGYVDKHVEQDKASEFIDTDKADKDNDGAGGPSKSELRDLHGELHDVGEKRGKKDDYDKRLAALATDFLPELGDADRGRFMGVVLEQDKGALDSWLQSDRLDKLVDEGRISGDDRKLVLDSVKSGYGDRHIDKDKASEFIDVDAPRGDGDSDDGIEAPRDVTEGGYQVAGAGEDVVYEDIKRVSYPGEYADGWLRLETEQGGKFAVRQDSAPGLYAVAERRYLDQGQKTVDQARERAGLDPAADTDVFALPTSVEQDGETLNVADAAMKLMIDGIKERSDLYDGSTQAQFLRLVEARSAVTSGRPIHPVYEDRISGAFTATRTRTENLVRLEDVDMKDMLDERAINRELNAVMGNEQISELYRKSLDEAIGKIPDSDRKQMVDKLADVVESADYVVEANTLSDADVPRAKADVEDAISQLSLLDPERAESAGQTFALHALAGEINTTFADPSLVTPEAAVDAVDAGLGAIKDGIGKAKLPFDIADKIDSFLTDGGKQAKEDFAKVLGGLRSEGTDPDSIDQVFDDTKFSSDQKDSIRGLVGDLSSNGLLPAVTGAIGITQTVRSLISADGFGDTPQEQMATAGGLLGMVSSLPGSTKLLGDVVKGIDGSAFDMLGIDKAIKSHLGVETRYANQATFELGKEIAGTEIPEVKDLPNADKITDGLQDAPRAKDLKIDGEQVARMSKAIVKAMTGLAGDASGMLGLVTGGMSLADADSKAEMAAGVLGVMSGTVDLAPSVMNGASKFVSAVGGKGAAHVVDRVFGAITRGLGPIGLVMTAVSELVSVFTGNAKARKSAGEQHDWFNKLADDGVMHSDWNVKYDFARTTLGEFDNLHSDHVKNARALKNADWGGRQAPEDRSIFDFHREEFASFRSEWEDNRGAPTYVTFLDPDARKADFKREKDQMDEVKAYMDAHPTFHPGHNDWVLEP